VVEKDGVDHNHIRKMYDVIFRKFLFFLDFNYVQKVCNYPFLRIMF
jgi:hypothetical protein